MTPARRRKRILKKKRKKKANPLIKPFIYLLLIASLLLFLLFQTKFWDKNSKIPLVINTKEGVVISVFDPKAEEITNIYIPANTQVRVARQLGSWKIGSVWELGLNEGFDGRLLAETVTYHMKFPVVAWADQKALGLATGNVVESIKSIFSPYKTNLKIGDRVKIGLFSPRVKNFKRRDIYLEETNYLKLTKFVDGEEGYILVGGVPNSLLAVFADPEITELAPKILISDSTKKAYIAEEVGEIIEVLGAKVVSITKDEKEGLDCEVISANKGIAKKIARVFSCDIINNATSGNFDLEIKIGEEFARRF